MEAVLARAREAGCRAAEVFAKDGRGRQLSLEPSSPGEPPRRIVSRTRESGAALRLVDDRGRAGFAWAGLGDTVEPARFVETALLAARLSGPGEAGNTEPAATGAEDRGMAAESAVAVSLAAPAGFLRPAPTVFAAGGPELELVDPGCFRTKDDAVLEKLRAGIAEVTRSGEAMVEVDRIVIGEVSTTNRLATAAGMRGAFERTLAMVSIALVPAAPEARAIVEERFSCRLEDLDVLECATEAVLRALPERATEWSPEKPADPVGGRPAVAPLDLVLAPRAAATLIASLAPAAATGSLPEIRRPSALTLSDDPTVAGRPSSAPFDGAGRPSRRLVLVEGGRSVGRIDAAGAHLQRLSYREYPFGGPSALVVAPGARAADSATGGESGRSGHVIVQAAIVDVIPGSPWTIRVRRGEVSRDGEPLGPADGLTWEGGLDRLIQAIAGTGDDSRWYQCGLPIRTPSLALHGLTSWRRGSGRI